MPLVTTSLVPVTAARDSKESGVIKVTYRWQGAWTEGQSPIIGGFGEF